ncbi:MAG: leucine-rich repeat domain-containing protein, partial [Clostridia bacterium]|nr:leucine-rich repeat domain-containing protein [Clostridia bacterium]
TLPSSVSALGDRAFAYTALQSVPDLTHVTKPGSSLFAYCAALTAATLPAHWQEIPNSIFDQCAKLEKVTFPPTVTVVGAKAFNGCEKITDFPFAEGLTAIGKEAFAGTALTAAHLPDSVKTLGDGAFAGCRKLAALTLPRGLTAIPADLAMGCVQLREIDIPAGVEMIGRRAFQQSGLRAVVLPAGLFDIREGTFESCVNLTEVHIPDRVTMIGAAAFRHCGLEEITLPAALSTIGKQAFEGCGQLKDLHLPDRLGRIEGHAFGNCTGLKKVHIPASVQSIYEGAFAGCDNIEAFTVEEESDSFTAEDGVLYTHFPPTLLAYPAARPDTAYTIPAGVERVGASAFQNARFLQELRVEAALAGEEPIGENAFLGANALKKVEFAAGTTALPRYCFTGSGLTQITLPGTLQTLNLEAFAGCELKELEMPAAVEAFIPGNVALERLTVHRDNGTFYDRDGVLFRWEDKALLWYPKGRADTAYEVPAGTRSVEEQAFRGCRQLTAVTFPEGLRRIGDNAFEDTGLTHISLPAGILELGSAFFFTPWWESQPDGPVYLGDILYAVKGQEALEELVVQEGTRVVTVTALSECVFLKRLVFPASVERIGDYFINPDVVIEGYRGTAAETYAKKRRYTFVALGEAPTTVSSAEAEQARGATPWVLLGAGLLAGVATGAIILRRKRLPKT